MQCDSRDSLLIADEVAGHSPKTMCQTGAPSSLLNDRT